jgi:hypothetical protein
MGTAETPECDPLVAGRPFVIYGTGTYADRLIEKRDLRVENLRFASTTGAGDFRGHSVMSAATLAKLIDIDIIIASTFLPSILESLRDLGVEGRRIWWYMFDADRLISFQALGTTPSRDRVLYAFYDLSMNPSTYDSVIFAARADVERQRRQLNHIQFIVVPSIISGGRPGDLERMGGLENVLWRQSYIIEAVFRLVPATRGVAILASRDDVGAFLIPGAQHFPATYDPKEPTDEHATKHCYDDQRAGFEPRVLKVPAKSVAFVTRFLESRRRDRKLLVLTLREYGHEPARNSNTAAWGQFLRSLDPEQYYAVVVRDTDSIYTEMPPGLEGFDDFPLASVDVNFRMALYEAAYLNLTVTTGPAGLLYFSMTARYLMFKQFVPEYETTAARFHLTRNGMNEGDAFPLAGPFQKFIWESDSPEVIRSEFDLMVAKIEAARP